MARNGKILEQKIQIEDEIKQLVNKYEQEKHIRLVRMEDEIKDAV